MKKLFKRIIAGLLSFIIVAVPVAMNLEDNIVLKTNAVEITTSETPTITSGTCGDNLNWTLDNNGLLYIYGTGAMANWDKSSQLPWYNYRTSIKELVIADGVTNISNSAFYDCDSLTSITIPNSITSIGEYALGIVVA